MVLSNGSTTRKSPKFTKPKKHRSHPHRRSRLVDSKEVNAFWNRQVDGLPCTKPDMALKQLPRLRPLALREEYGNLHLDYGNSHRAALGQMRGQIALEHCTRCARENGPFTECVTLADWFSGACCNCYYNRKGQKCSFRDSGKLHFHSSRSFSNSS